MDRIDFKDGFHLTPEAMQFLQDAYTTPINAIAKSGGIDNYIVTGCNIVGDRVTEGAIVFAGKIYPFEACELGEFVAIEESVGYNTNSSGNPEPAYRHYSAKCVAQESPNTVRFESLRRMQVKFRLNPTEFAPLPVCEGFEVIPLEFPHNLIIGKGALLKNEGAWRINASGQLQLIGLLHRTGDYTFGTPILRFPFTLPHPVKFRAYVVASTSSSSIIEANCEHIIMTIGMDGAMYVDKADYNYTTPGLIYNYYLFDSMLIDL